MLKAVNFLLLRRLLGIPCDSEGLLMEGDNILLRFDEISREPEGLLAEGDNFRFCVLGGATSSTNLPYLSSCWV